MPMASMASTKALLMECVRTQHKGNKEKAWRVYHRRNKGYVAVQWLGRVGL